MYVCMYVKEMPYARAKNIDFSSANKLRSMKSSTRKLRIYNSRKPRTSSFYFQQLLLTSSSGTASAGAYSAHRHLRKKMDQFYAKLNQCKIKAVALSLIDPFADQIYRLKPLCSDSFRARCLLQTRSLSSFLFVAS